MSKRTYNKIQHLLPIIQEKLATGMTQEEVAKELGRTGKKAIKNLLNRERKKELAGIPQVRGRKPARTLQEYKYENERLKMENERCGILCNSRKGCEAIR